jgi:restriction system protein
MKIPDVRARAFARNVSTKDQKKAEASKPKDYNAVILELRQILLSALKYRNRFEWDSLKSGKIFDQAVPAQPVAHNFPSEPKPFKFDYAKFDKFDFLDKIIPSRRRKLEQENKKLEQKDKLEFEAQHMQWKAECESLRREADARYAARVREWKKARDEFENARLQANDAVDDLCARYKAGDLTIEEYCDIVLCNSAYPDNFPREWATNYDSETGILVIEFRLPALADMPTIKEIKYIASRDVFEEVRLKENFVNALYDSVVYQVCLRTLHELYTSDEIRALKSVVFNGWVHYINPANGQETQACIVSVQALAEQFKEINLAAVDPKSCFRALKGIGSTQLHAMAPVQPRCLN